MSEKCSRVGQIIRMAEIEPGPLLGIFLAAQGVIEHPLVPVAKKPNRSLELLEVLRIKDAGDKFSL